MYTIVKIIFVFYGWNVISPPVASYFVTKEHDRLYYKMILFVILSFVNICCYFNLKTYDRISSTYYN